MSALVDIRPQDLAIVQGILRDHVPKARVWVFGSRAKWTTRDSSDLDLALDLGRPMTLAEESSLRSAFEESDLPYKVDLADRQTAKPSFREIIDRDGVPLGQQTAPFLSLLSHIVDNRGRTCPTAESGLPLIATNCVKNSTLYPVFEKVRYVDRHTYETWFRGHPLPGDFIFVCKGSPGQVCLTPDPVNFCIAQDMVAVRADPAKIYPPYLFAALRSDEIQNAITNMHVGTMIPHFKKGDFDKLKIPVPDEATQKLVGDMYLLLTEKIELNRQVNDTLGRQAQAIFRDWFIDFGPVRRKLAGATDPLAIMGDLTPDRARAAELAGLFPEILDNDGVPVGWKERPLDSIAEFLNGLALQKYPAKAGEPDLPVIKIAELRNGLSERSNRAARTLPSKYIIRDGDFLFSWSGSLMAKVWTEGEGALNQHLFKVSSAEYPQWFYGLWVQHHMPEFQLVAASKATTMGHIQRGHLNGAATICPPDDAIEVMSSVIGPLWDRMIQNELESRTLAETRDYLLPRLMSGAVRVRPSAKAA